MVDMSTTSALGLLAGFVCLWHAAAEEISAGSDSPVCC